MEYTKDNFHRVIDGLFYHFLRNENSLYNCDDGGNCGWLSVICVTFYQKALINKSESLMISYVVYRVQSIITVK